MSLYPVITIQPATANNSFTDLPAGTLALIPLDMTNVTLTTMTLIQVSLTQDFSLRAWVSAAPNGISVVAPPASMIPVLRGSGLPIVVHTAAQEPPSNCTPIAVAHGQYYLNVLNLTNETNIFVFSMSDWSAEVSPIGVVGDSVVGSFGFIIMSASPTLAGVVGMAAIGGLVTSTSRNPTGVRGTAAVGICDVSVENATLRKSVWRNFTRE